MTATGAKRATLRGSLRALPREAWILYGGSFVNRFGSFVLTFLILYLRSRGYAPAGAGAAVSAYGLGGLGAASVGGYLADRLGRRQTIVLSMFASAATVMALSQAGSLTAIVPLTALAGFSAELYRPASAALLADLVPAGQRVAAFAAYRLAVNAGFAFGPAVAGFLAERSFFLLFVGDALTSAAYGVIALTLLPTGSSSRREQEQRGEAVRAVLADRTFLAFLLASLFAAFVYMQSISSFALHVRASGLSNAVYGALVSLNGLIIVFLELPLTSVTQRFPARPIMALGTLLVALGFGLTALAHSVLPLAGTVLVWTLGEIANAPVASAYVADLAPPHLRGRYQGAWVLTFALAFVMAPTLGTALFQWSPTGLWLVCGLLGTVAAGLILASPARRVVPSVAGPEPGPEIPGLET